MLLSVPTVEWSATLIGIGLLFGLLLGYWLGTFNQEIKYPTDPDEGYESDYRRKPTLTRAENLARERMDYARLPED